jgi:DNA-binding transcriptional MerR regulator
MAHNGRMTKEEASRAYNIPVEIFDQYENWGLCDTVGRVLDAWLYDDRDLERLSMIMTLHDIGFNNSEIETYMRLLLTGESTDSERLRMLNLKRDSALDEIHLKERQLQRLDYLRHKINNNTHD